MDSDEFIKQLHVRASKGETLSAQEQKLLDDWYASQDALESAMLTRSSNDKTIENLRAQLEISQSQLIAVMQRIQQVTIENDALRREIDALRRQLIRRHGAQPA